MEVDAVRPDSSPTVDETGKTGHPHGLAARRRRRLRRPVSIAINLTPMIDVTFLLLIFYLVTTTFERPEGLLASKLPKDSSQVSVPLPLTPIVIRLKQIGPGGDDFAITIDNFGALPKDFRALAASLTEIQEKEGYDADTPVVIQAQDAVRWDHVVNCWNAVVRAKFHSIVFGES